MVGVYHAQLAYLLSQVHNCKK